MLTPQDIQGKEFVKAVFGGYDMTAVDEFLEQLTQDYSALYKENAILKSKIKVLVEKVEEYRSTEDAMRMALLTAQRMGEDLTAEAKKKSQAMLDDADAAVKARMEELSRTVDEENYRLTRARERTAQFVEASNIMLRKHAEFLSRLDELKPDAAPAAKPAPAPAPKPAPAPAPVQTAAPAPVSDDTKEVDIVNTAMEIDSRVSSATASLPNPKGVASAKTDGKRAFRTNTGSIDWADDDEPTSPRPKFDFSNLKFGSNYDDDK